VLIRDVLKTESRFGFSCKKTVQKIDIHTNGFPAETVCKPQFMLKMTKINLVAFSVEITVTHNAIVTVY